MINGTSNSWKKRMGIAALIVSGGVLLSRILGQVREMIFAGMLGADAVTDQYVAAFRIPDFLNYLLAGGFLSITFIPIFSRYLARGSEAEGWQALSAILKPITAGAIGLLIIGWNFAPGVIEAIYPEFTEEQIDITVRLTRIAMPAQIFFVLGALFSSVQYAKGQFLIPTLAPIIYNLSMIIGGIAFALVTGHPDPEGFIWGAVIGAFVGNFALQWWGAQRVGMRLNFTGKWKHPALREYVVIALPLMIGQSIVMLDESFMSIFGDLVGDGAQTQLQYARRTMLVPVGVIAQAAGVAAYPFLARLFAAGRHTEMAATVDKALRWVLALSIGAAALLAALSQPAIQVLFQRFHFTPVDTTATASALFFFAFAVPLWGGLQVITRAFYASRNMWTPVLVGTGTTILAIPIYWRLQLSHGLPGVAVSGVLALSIYTIALAILWYRQPLNRGRLGTVLDTAGRAVVPSILGGFGAYSLARATTHFLGESFISALLSLIIGVLAFAITALVATTLMWRIQSRTEATNETPAGR